MTLIAVRASSPHELHQRLIDSGMASAKEDRSFRETGARIVYGSDSAFYHLATDNLHLPSRELSLDPGISPTEAYYGHSTRRMPAMSG
ncbi:MAG: hypothetical protein B7Z80_01715 [Rhodospirillales bacterium 20-64-7]|nr:MAG: hypothetical protein B7Z80_01715 [Rhodospirillales bacterium 20-64-7]